MFQLASNWVFRRLLGGEALLHFGHCLRFLLDNDEQCAQVLHGGLHTADALRERQLFHSGVTLAGNVDLFRSAAPKDLNNEGSRLGERSQGLPLDGEPRLPK